MKLKWTYFFSLKICHINLFIFTMHNKKYDLKNICKKKLEEQYEGFFLNKMDANEKIGKSHHETDNILRN